MGSLKSLKKKVLSQIKELEAIKKAAMSLGNDNAAEPIVPRRSSGTSEATAIVAATDWHLGERVKPETVSGLNKFDVAIGTERVRNLFEKIVRLTKKERQDVKIDELILFLGGDLIGGALHLDTIMANEIAEPVEQAIVASSLIEAGLNFLLNNGGYKRITCICCDGNHGRITSLLHHSTQKGNALEYLMYYELAKRFPGINWNIANGIHVYQDIYGQKIRFLHGDTINFRGVNGPYTYLNRRIFQWDQAVPANYSIQGHLHTYTLGTRKWVINGSLIGYNPFAVSFGGEFQPPPSRRFCSMIRSAGQRFISPSLYKTAPQYFL